jgi:phage N-6-adenine-methyltransferase
MSGKGNSNISATPDNQKDLWQTPPFVVEDAARLIGQGFALDACAADIQAAKAAEFITPEMDALTVDWWPAAALGAVWCNPPFSQKEAFLQRAHEQARLMRLTVCCLVPLEPSTTWWRTHVTGKATAVYIPDGRYPFIHPETGLVMGSPNFASCFVVFTPLTMPTQYIEFERTKMSKRAG